MPITPLIFRDTKTDLAKNCIFRVALTPYQMPKYEIRFILKKDMFVRSWKIIHQSWLILFPLVSLLLLSSSISFAESLFIEVQSVKLRSQPKAWAPPVADLKYGDEVEVVETNAPWIKVRTKDLLEGFLHSTATTSRPVILKSNANTNAKLDTFEAVLAGKGFSSSTEISYAKAHEKLDFTLVDSMESRSRKHEAEVLSFMQSGGLNIKEQG